MNKVLSEQISIILETISFFLVTIDLYGKERLVLLRSRIVKNRLEDIQRKKYFNKIVLVSTTIIVVCANLIVKSPWLWKLNWNFIKEHYVIFSLIVIIGLIINTYEDKVEQFIRDKILGNLVNCFLFILSIFPIEGIMIVIGSTLFIISKIIAFMNI